MTERVNCTGCTACVAVCPHDAIEMKPDAEGFLQPLINEELCIGCGLCDRVCPVGHEQQEPQATIAYLAYAGDDQLRKTSSSGGLFSQLAQRTILEGGIVFGCAMTENGHKAHHIAVENIEDLQLLRGSKYVQSDMGDILVQAKAAVQSGRKVLFSGTPCQTAGFKALLDEKTYPNLLIVDVICHGVPSPGVWDAYIKGLEKEYGSPVKKVVFRDKITGWKKYSLTVQFNDGSQYSCPVDQEPYMRGFLQDIYLRNSCYRCAFKAGKSNSDITLGDFWGVERIQPELSASEGVSLLLVNSLAGKSAVEMLSEKCYTERVDLNQALKSNPAYSRCAEPCVIRDFVIHRVMQKKTLQRLKHYTDDSLISRCCRKVGKTIGGKLFNDYFYK